MTPVDILKKYWGYEAFRPMQEDIIQSVLTGTDTLAILPTGGGKSICFQVPALNKDGVCLVVTPLIALMHDQVQQLTARGLTAIALHSGLSRDEVREILKDTVKGAYKFLYVSPERLATGAFREALPWLPLSLVAVDEAHCISQWGYDFRPSYLEIASIRTVKPKVPILALTASATPDVQKDILSQLLMKAPAVFRQSFERPNLSYSVFKVASRMARLREILQKVQGSAIVYCKTRKRTTEISTRLLDEGIQASFYHAGLTGEERQKRQDAWIKNEIRVMVCTNAFGMGIDKPDVRLVIHTAPPDCLENYYQEAGRAGRDGKKSYAVLLYDQKDADNLKAYPDIRFPPMATIRKVYQAMVNYLQLPVGLGQDMGYALDIQDLIHKFNLTLTETLNSLLALQQGGVLSFQEQLFQPSTVQVIASRDDLDALNSVNPALEETLKSMLRTYGGLFDHPTVISEKNLAWISGTELNALISHLKHLHGSGLIKYSPKKESPQVRFLQNRVRAEDLYIAPIAYNQRRAVFAKRVDTMIEFLQAGEGCRAAYIGRYFGDSEIRDCGICDHCLQLRKKKINGDALEALARKAVGMLSQAAMSVSSLQEKLQPVSKELFWAMIRDWEAERKITVLDDGRIMLKKKGPG